MKKQNRTPMTTSLERYIERTLEVLNESLAWNIARLPNNTLELQLLKYIEETDEAIEAEKISYQNFIEELADVVITIGGIARFDEQLAVEMFNDFLDSIDKYIYMDAIDYAKQKIKILYQRDYSNGWHHKEIIQ